VFLILAALYESWSLPFSVLLSLPIAVVGAYLALWGRTLENNAYAQIGLIMLIGLAAKNAILIVEFARMELEHGKPLIDAALEGARLRLRPILMTSFAFILGCVPLIFALGAGMVSRRILGTTVVGGMLAASNRSRRRSIPRLENPRNRLPDNPAANLKKTTRVFPGQLALLFAFSSKIGKTIR
jgi:HAE1 family hydrophobic/amphiphilic exporter-1